MHVCVAKYKYFIENAFETQKSKQKNMLQILKGIQITSKCSISLQINTYHLIKKNELNIVKDKQECKHQIKIQNKM